MSRYESKAELIEVIKRTAATDYNKLGTPLGAENFNMAGLIRDCKIDGDRRYGWNMTITPDEFKDAIKRNVRGFGPCSYCAYYGTRVLWTPEHAKTHPVLTEGWTPTA